MLKSTAVDDITHPLKCTILEWKRLPDHVEYVIEVKKQLGDENSWLIQRRYADFRKLSMQIEKFGIDLGLPPKKFIGNSRETFIKQRMLALQAFLDSACLYPFLYACPMMASFLGSFTETYADLHEWILLSFRDKHEWTIGDQIKHCGWRPGKVHYNIRRGCSELILSGIHYGPDRFGTVAELNSALEFLRTLQCPYISDSVSSWANDGGILYVRPIFKNGTLRDKLYNSNWKEDFFTKYKMDSSVYPFETADIRIICRQLLETLTLLNALSIPFLDIHAGNVVITEHGCELIDLDQVLAGQPSFRRPSVLCSHVINTLEDMLVFAFGELLFEILTGFFTFPMDSIAEAFAIVPPDFQSLLNSILLPEVRSLPSLQDLISSSLFVDVPIAKMKQREIRIPVSIKKVFDGLCNNILERYKKERMQFRINNRQRKFQQLLNSEAEKVRRKEIIRRVDQFMF